MPLKKHFFLFVLVLLCLSFSFKSVEKKGKAIISGRYVGFDKPLTIYVTDYGKQLGYSYPIYLDTITTSADGSFSFTLPLDEPKEILLTTGDVSDRLFVEKNDSIYFESDKDFDSPLQNIKGKGSDKIKVMVKTRRLLYLSSLAVLDSAAIMSEAVNQINTYNFIIDSIKNKLSDKFVNYITAQKLQRTYYFYWAFPDYINSYKNIDFPSDTALLNKARKEIIGYSVNGYKNADFADNLYSFLLRKVIDSDNVNDTRQLEEYSRLIKSTKLPDDGIQLMMGKVFLRYLSKGKIKAVEPFITNFNKQYPNSIYRPILKKQYAEWTSLSKGKTAPDFTATSINDGLFKLSDLKEKVVYVDIWATWCGPCRAEFPYTKKIKEHFKGNDNIVFLYVSVDDEKEAWRKFLQSNPDLEGLHVFDVGGFKSQIAKAYKVNSIPRYMIIDARGNIFVTDASRPSSDEKLIKQLEEALLLKEDSFTLKR